MLRRSSVPRLGITEGDEEILSSEKIVLLDTLTYLDSMISKDDGFSQNIKRRIAKVQGFFFSVEKSFDE